MQQYLIFLAGERGIGPSPFAAISLQVLKSRLERKKE